MIKAIKREDQDVYDYRYFCDICEKEIDYPSSINSAKICFRDEESDRMLYSHLCNQCVMNIVKNEMIKVYKVNNDSELVFNDEGEAI